MTQKIGVLFATSMEAKSCLAQPQPDNCKVAISGMGMEAASLATRQLIEQQHVTLIINPGVCGALDNSLIRHSVYFISDTWNESQTEQIPLIPMPNSKRLVTVEKPVFQADRKQKLATFADLVDMEGFAVAKQCQAHHIPCVLIKGITDFGDTHGKADIQTHIASVSEKITQTLFDFIENLQNQNA